MDGHILSELEQVKFQRRLFMKKKAFIVGILTFMFVFGISITGCTTGVSLVKQASLDTPVNNQCLLLITSVGTNLTITSFDDQKVRWYSRATGFGYINKVIAISSGKHVLASKLSASFTAKIEYDFLPGRYYEIKLVSTAKTLQLVTDDTTKLVVSDVTDQAQDGGHYSKIFSNAKKKAGL